jgi:hypothetical protein
MKNYILAGALSLFFMAGNAQDISDKALVEKACMNYLDGFYQGDTLKIKQSLKPSLNKLGFWKDKTTGEYAAEGYMSFDEAVQYSRNILENQRFVSPEAPKKVEVLDIMNQIAAAKVTAWWGTDYLLLSKAGDQWMIEQVIWEGPLDKK